MRGRWPLEGSVTAASVCLPARAHPPAGFSPAARGDPLTSVTSASAQPRPAARLGPAERPPRSARGRTLAGLAARPPLASLGK